MGFASYHDVTTEGRRHPGLFWYYRAPFHEVSQINGLSGTVLYGQPVCSSLSESNDPSTSRSGRTATVRSSGPLLELAVDDQIDALVVGAVLKRAA